MDKHLLRRRAVDMLKDIPAHQRKETERKMVDRLLESVLWSHASTVGVTVSQGIEWNTKPIIEAAWQLGKMVYVPKCIPAGRVMTFYQLDHFDQLELGAHGLLEPVPDESREIKKDGIELLIVPGILFDQEGYRIGFGGGYYDRFLIDYPNRTVSIVSEKQMISHLPKESFDIPVQYLVTEKEIVFTG
ncbi:5-formyltetrahydrofolate cyclo-ligase [Virgibacillus sediminis]|uniref:5-formyltetrahydrofolate cyclo-ligase n=1 Tax=Virgibacillus sediminis TaxID=202260 RepID=A0ABV7A5Q8_9BACI